MIEELQINPLCFDEEGQIDINLEGGIEPYTIIWSNGEDGEVITTSQGSEYAVTITDDNGCTGTADFETPPLTQVSIDVVEVIETNSSNNSGSIEVTAEGGVGPYSYLWDNGSSGNSISGLSTGNYSVVVTDANGCEAVATFNIVSSALGIQSLVDNNICIETCEGRIELEISGGIEPYDIACSSGDTEAT